MPVTQDSLEERGDIKGQLAACVIALVLWAGFYDGHERLNPAWFPGLCKAGFFLRAFRLLYRIPRDPGEESLKSLPPLAFEFMYVSYP